MSMVFYLASLKTMQKVEVGCSSIGSMRGTQEPKALALFCHAHMGEVVEMMIEKDLEIRLLDHGELATWTDETADQRYKAVTSDEPPRTNVTENLEKMRWFSVFNGGCHIL